MAMACGHLSLISLRWSAFLPYIFHSLQGFPGDLARSFSDDATLSDVLQMLDEHYGAVMTFDALRKELYSLKQGSNGNIAEFGVHLSQQVQILQSEYLGRIQQKHVEEMKCSCFYDGLNPKYWLIKWLWGPGQLLWPASSHMKAGKMGRSQGPSTTKDGCN